MYTTAKYASVAVTQVVNTDTANLKIAVNLMTLMLKTRLRTAEVLEISEPLQVTQVHDR